jgi:hypothetical protein
LVSGSKLVVLQVGGGDLQAVEQEAGGLLFDLAGEQHLHDLHDRHLDRVCVFEDRERDCRSDFSCAGGVDDELALVPLLVEVAEAVVFEKRGSRTGCR